MPEMTEAAPIADRPPLQLEGNTLAIASPAAVSEASFSIPAVRALRAAQPKFTLIVFANEATAPMWRKVPDVHQVIEHHSGDSARKIARLLKESKISFDASIAWEDSSTAQAFSKYGIRQRLGYPAGNLTKSLTEPVEVVRKIGPIEHQVNHYLLFVEKLAANPFQASNFAFPPRPPAPEKFHVTLVPGSDFGPAAEWPLDRYVEFATEVLKHCEISILPSPNRPGPATALAKALGAPSLKLDLEHDALLDHLATCHGLIGNDGSIPHYASFVGTPSLVIFGPNEPEWKRPLGRIHRVIRHHVPCSGCLLNKCPLDHRCMDDITVNEVFGELKSLFEDA